MMQAHVEVRSDTKSALKEMRRDFKDAWSTGVASEPVTKIIFSSVAQVFTIFNIKRWELIEQLQKIGPSTIRGLTRALGRDVRRVHDDVMVLIEWGIAEKDKDGKVFVPFDVIHIGVDIRAAA
jgi:predicted transcriptional regulator